MQSKDYQLQDTISIQTNSNPVILNSPYNFITIGKIWKLDFEVILRLNSNNAQALIKQGYYPDDMT